MTQQVEHRLAALLNAAIRSTSFWSQRLGAYPSDPDASSLEVLEKLPLLSRRELQRNRPRLMSTEGDVTTWRTVRTSGVTGEPVEVVRDAESIAAEHALLASHLDRSLDNAEWRDHDLVHVALHQGATSRSKAAPWSREGRLVKWNLMQLWGTTDDVLISGLRALDGCVVTLMPSVALLLASRIRQAGATGVIRPRIVLLSGEQLSLVARTEIAAVFDTVVTSAYTIAEAGILGTECADDYSYHVEDRATYVEITNEAGRPCKAGERGELVVTPLFNLAMPLLRYRTGDEGTWLLGECRCGREEQRLVLHRRRRPARLLRTSTATASVVGFAKVLAGVGVDRFAIEQRNHSSVLVAYEASYDIDERQRGVVVAAVREALGPEVDVEVRRYETVPEACNMQANRNRHHTLGSISPEVVARWLAPKLSKVEGINSAVLTGSFLNSVTTTRFSDIDVVALGSAPMPPDEWSAIARDLRSFLPRLSLIYDAIGGLSERAPLVVCRLLLEQITLLGRIDESTTPWPAIADIRSEARFWCQVSRAQLLTRLVATDPATDPIHEAWLASKYAIDALRYRYLLRGGRITASLEILRFAEADTYLDRERVHELSKMYRIAREHLPPPPEGGPVEAFLETALYFVSVAAGGVSD